MRLLFRVVWGRRWRLFRLRDVRECRTCESLTASKTFEHGERRWPICRGKGFEEEGKIEGNEREKRGPVQSPCIHVRIAAEAQSPAAQSQ